MQMAPGSDIFRNAKEVEAIMQSSMNKEQLKDVIKTALVEVLEERQDLFQEAIETALEDIALTRAIKEGEKTKPVKKGEVFKILEGKA
jgi:phage terminase small subunit